ncbi:MAG: gamma-glutamyltransferase [Pseudomonadota bacterium]|nr:gamma-glutamyltransferase [Pseudomonadota bacterium]
MNHLIQFLSFLIIFFSIGLHAATQEGAFSSKGMVVSRSSLASDAGLEIMRQGGNAVDAAVATAFALAVTYPSAGNLGGGGFALVRLPDGRIFSLDHRETAPNASHRDMYLDEAGEPNKYLSRASALSSGVPGSVDGLLTLLDRFGTMPREKVIAPAIRLARDGFLVDFFLSRHIRKYGKKLQDFESSKKKFSHNGAQLSEGDLWIQPDLAKTLVSISQNGRDGFYDGEVAKLIVAEMQARGGIITLQDLKNYRSVWREPVGIDYRGNRIWTMGPPSSGLLILQILNMLEPFDLQKLGWGSSRLTHLMVEAEKRAYSDRAEYLGDPDFFDVPLEMLISKKYAKERFKDFEWDRVSKSDQISHGNITIQENRETTHFSVMSSDGMAVSFTTTLNSPYGNKIVIPGAGFLLNNEMDDFSIKANVMNQYDLLGREANSIKPNKRMLSSMSPTLVVKDGMPILVTGSPGGSTIITTVLQVIINFLDHKMPLHHAVGFPRFHHQWKPDTILHERGAFSPDTRENLERMGYQSFRISTYGGGIGDANSISFDGSLIQGVKDPRASGGAVGL